MYIPIDPDIYMSEMFKTQMEPLDSIIFFHNRPWKYFILFVRDECKLLMLKGKSEKNHRVKNCTCTDDHTNDLHAKDFEKSITLSVCKFHVDMLKCALQYKLKTPPPPTKKKNKKKQHDGQFTLPDGSLIPEFDHSS